MSSMKSNQSSDSGNGASRVSRIRIVLRTGSMVFGVSALALIIVPSVFNGLLGLTSTEDLEWAMRMIGITLVALSGNMLSVATRGSEASVLLSAKVMLFSAFALGVLTLVIPAALNWFTILYATVGFSFSLAYLIALIKK